MIYEIYYEPRGGVWRIRVTVIYFLFFSWSRVACDGSLSPLDFTSYKVAEEYAETTGLSKAYQKRTRGAGYVSWLHGEGCHA